MKPLNFSNPFDMKVQITAQLHELQDIQVFPSGFQKQVAVLIIPGDYPDYFPIEMLKEKVGSFDSIQLGQTVTVNAYLGGREYSGRYYLDLKFAGIEGVATPAPQAAPAPVQPAPAAPAASDDGLPF